MGKVFLWNDIKNHRVPTPENFEEVVEQLIRCLTHCRGVVGAMLCGSVLMKCSNLRSDIDCLVLYDGRHISQAFATHLIRTVEHGGVIKTNPLSAVNVPAFDSAESIRGYLRSKLGRFEKSFIDLPAMSERERCYFLQRVLESAVHIARKMLWHWQVNTLDDTKPTISKHYLLKASEEECELFRKIVRVDSQYTEELLEQLRLPNKKRYDQIIQELEELVVDSIRLLKLSALQLS